MHTRVSGDMPQVFSDPEYTAIVESLRLSNREMQIARYALDDRTEAEIGGLLGLPQRTVHMHFERLYRKLGAHSRCGLLVAMFARFRQLQQGAVPAQTPPMGTSETKVMPNGVRAADLNYPLANHLLM